MKKIIYLLFVVCLTTLLVGCGTKTANSEKEMLEIITEELEWDASVNIIETIELEDVILVVYMTDNPWHMYGYATFEKHESSYKFLRTYETMEKGQDLHSAMYRDSWLFISNNEDSHTLFIKREEEEKIIPIDDIPFVYFLEDVFLPDEDFQAVEIEDGFFFAGELNFEYHFLDENGEEISR